MPFLEAVEGALPVRLFGVLLIAVLLAACSAYGDNKPVPRINGVPLLGSGFGGGGGIGMGH
jgi:hypothetical protein